MACRRPFPSKSATRGANLAPLEPESRPLEPSLAALRVALPWTPHARSLPRKRFRLRLGARLASGAETGVRGCYAAKVVSQKI